MKKFNRTFKLLGAVALASILVTGCSDNNNNNTPTTTTTVYTHYLYNVNQNPTGTSTVSEFQQHADTGGLSAGAATSPYLAGVDATEFAFNPAGTVAFVTNEGSSTISEYLIASADGSLTSNGTITAGGSGFPSAGIVDPRGLFYFTANQSDVSVYIINQTTGQLTLQGTATINGATPQQLACDATGTFLFVTATSATAANAGVYAFTYDATSGALQAVQSTPYNAGVQSVGLTVDNASHVYTTDGSSNIYGFSIGSTGILTTLGSQFPVSVNAGSLPGRMVFEPNHGALYVAEAGSNSLGAFLVTPGTGALTSVAGQPFGTGAGSFPVAIALDPTGNYLYNTNEDTNSIGAWAIGSNAALVNPSTFGTGVAPIGIRLLQFVSTQTTAGTVSN